MQQNIFDVADNETGGSDLPTIMPLFDVAAAKKAATENLAAAEEAAKEAAAKKAAKLEADKLAAAKKAATDRKECAARKAAEHQTLSQQHGFPRRASRVGGEGGRGEDRRTGTNNSHG